MTLTGEEAAVSSAIAAATLSLPVGLISLKRRLVSKSGLVASILVAIISGLAGLQSFLYVLMFYLSSSLLTKLKYSEKSKKGAAENPRGRDWRQVLGAGGVGTFFFAASFVSSLLGDLKFSAAFLVAALTSFAVSNADTWASEIGSLSKTPPRLIVKPWVKVPPGTSGGITMLGELASITGAALMSLTLWALSSHLILAVPSWAFISSSACRVPIIIFLVGWLGEILDSIVGALFQAKYYCPRCKVVTDKKLHKCGATTVFYRGFKWLGNETTNIISTFTAAICACLLYLMYF